MTRGCGTTSAGRCLSAGARILGANFDRLASGARIEQSRPQGTATSTQLNQCRDAAKFDLPMTGLTCCCPVSLGAATTDQVAGGFVRRLQLHARPGPAGVGEGDAEGTSRSSSRNRSISSGPPSRSTLGTHPQLDAVAMREARLPSRP